MLGIVLVLFGACSYGVLSTFVTLAYRAGFTVQEVVGSQMLFACLFTWGIALMSKGRGAATGDWLKLLGVGLATGSTGIFYYASLQYVSASLAIVLLFQFTWIGILIDSIVTRSLPGRDKLVSLLFLFVGTALAGGVFHGEQHLTFLGVALGLLSAVSYAVFLLLSGRVAQHVNPWTRSAIVMTGSALLVVIVFPPTFLLTGALFQGLLVYGLILAFFVVVSTVLINIGVPKTGAGIALILSSAELPMAVTMSRFVLQESIHPTRWVGVLIILLGIAFPEIYSRIYGMRTSQSTQR